MLNIGSALWVLLVVWPRQLVSSSDSDCRQSGAGYSSCGFRWLHPCRGSSQLDVEMEIESEADWISDLDLSDALARLSAEASKLKKKIRDVINLYVIGRFGNEQVAQDLDSTGFRIDGMPSVELDSFELELTPNIHTAYEYLARIGVFLSHMVQDERVTITENVYYEKHFQNLEDDLYLILCSLSQIIKKLEKPLSSDVIEGIFDLKVVKADRNSIRHIRDYLILRDFEQIVEALNRNFITLRRLRRY